MKKITSLLISSLFALTACSGGSGNSSETSGIPADYASRYVGTWNAQCLYTQSITTPAHQFGTNAIMSINIPSYTGSTVTGTLTYKVYASTDTTCSGAMLGSMSKALTTTIESVGTGPANSDKINTVLQNASSSGASVTISGVTYGNSLTVGSTFKDIAFLNPTFTQMNLGNNPNSSTIYPTALSANTYTKQSAVQ